MSTIEIQSCCNECKSSVVDDIHNGERICSGCGIVVDEQMADLGPETKTSNLEDKMRLARATGQTTLAQHDMGIATDISISSTDFSGKKTLKYSFQSNAKSKKMATKSSRYIST